MFTRRYTLFRLFGFSVRLDLSWLLLGLLVSWSLAITVFPDLVPGMSASTYWWMGIAGALGLLVSIVLHELSHALVARRYGLAIHGITLFLFGGVSEMAEEPREAQTEFFMAAAGPVMSFVLAAVCYGAYRAFDADDTFGTVSGLLYYLAGINLALGIFNLVPGFPLDGGRMLRAALWAWKRDLHWATRVAAQLGSLVGLALILLGVFSVVSGNFVGGMWWFLIGLFLRSAAGMSYKQMLIRESIQGEPVSRFMNSHPITVDPHASLQTLVDDYIYHYHHKAYPVVDGDRPLGVVGMEQVKAVPRAEWSARTVAQAMEPSSADNTVTPDTDALQAWRRMSGSGKSRLLVLDRGRLVGFLALRDLMNFLSLKFDLERAKA